MAFGDEIRLAFLLLLNAAVLAAAWHATRRWTVDPLRRVTDTLLLWFAVQYAAVCIPGVLHVLSLGTMSLAAILLAAGLFVVGRRGATITVKPVRDPPPPAHLWLLSDNANYLAASLFVIGIIGAVIYKQEFLPLTDSDAMTYHAPVAVTWLQTGKLGLFPVWFFNPANTFSPLAGSVFITWLMAPLGGDVLARAVQGPPLLLLFFAILQVGRSAGLSAAIAALVAIATVVSRPFNSEIMGARDDVFLAAFIATAVAGCSTDALRERFAPWRIGVAVGLAAATKYTFLFALPVLLLVVDSPVRAGWRWRQWAKAVGAALIIAGPWYLRNLLLTGNPLYPVELKLLGHRILPGLFEAATSERLRTFTGLQGVLIGGRPGQGAFHGPPPWLLAMLVVGWIAALIGRWREAARQPMVRACVLGLPLCLALFIAKAPYGEVRFLFPALSLMFVAAGLGIAMLARWPQVAIAVAGALAAVALLTSYQATMLVWEIALPAVLLTLLGISITWANRHFGGGRRTWAYLATVGAVCLVMAIYVYWPGYQRICREARYTRNDEGRREKGFWAMYYPQMAGAWQFIDENVSANGTVAYVNTYHVYPLYGPSLTRRVIYVPVRFDVPDFLHLPHFPGPVHGEQIEATFSKLLCENPAHDTWLRRLLDSKAEYLFIVRAPPLGDPPELAFAREDRAHFTSLYEDEGASIYRVNR